MKITKSINRQDENKKYYKFIVTIPNKHLKELKWDENTYLNMKVVKDRLVIEKGK